MDVVKRVIDGIPVADGAGVRMTRVIGQPGFQDLDPFLLLDEFRSDNPDDYLAGFPDHPHRGFQTVTYMLAGNMRHNDNKGHSGVIGPGGVQWMHAGSGIIHSEMPEQKNGLMWGFQLWVNLPAKQKMTPAKYYEFSSHDIPVVKFKGGMVKVIAGRTPEGVEGAVKDLSDHPIYLDYTLEAGASYSVDLETSYHYFVYVFEGSLNFPQSPTEMTVQAKQLAIIEAGQKVNVLNGEKSMCRFLLVGGKPLNEPVARYGPFVMNSEGELKQAIADFQAGKF